MDALMTLLGVAGVSYIMGIPGADDVMLNYQSTSFHDDLYLRQVLGLRCTPGLETWLEGMGIMHDGLRLADDVGRGALVDAARASMGGGA